MINWESKDKEWREAYPRVMKFDDVPMERRVTPEFILEYRGEDGRQESENLEGRKCAMAVDYGGRWGKRFGIYARCGTIPSPNEILCHQHGGPRRQREKDRLRNRQEKILMRAKEDLQNSIDYYSQIISVASEELKNSKEKIRGIEDAFKNNQN